MCLLIERHLQLNTNQSEKYLKSWIVFQSCWDLTSKLYLNDTDWYYIISYITDIKIKYWANHLEWYNKAYFTYV